MTICTQDPKFSFGDIVNGKVRLNRLGRVVKESWEWLPRRYRYVKLDQWILMPNHLHGIIILEETDVRRGGSRTAPTNFVYKRKPLGRLIGAFKTVSTKRINQLFNTPGRRIWQRDFYDHIIRNDADLRRIREYIMSNPLKWELDEYNPDVGG